MTLGKKKKKTASTLEFLCLELISRLVLIASLNYSLLKNLKISSSSQVESIAFSSWQRVNEVNLIVPPINIHAKISTDSCTHFFFSVKYIATFFFFYILHRYGILVISWVIFADRPANAFKVIVNLPADFHCESPVFVKLEWYSLKTQNLLKCSFLISFWNILVRFVQGITCGLLFDKKL